MGSCSQNLNKLYLCMLNTNRAKKNWNGMECGTSFLGVPTGWIPSSLVVFADDLQGYSQSSMKPVTCIGW